MAPSRGRCFRSQRCSGDGARAGREVAMLDAPRCFGGQRRPRTTCALSRSTQDVADPLRLKSLDVTVRTRLPPERALDFRLAAPSISRRCALNIRSSCSIVSGLPAKNSNPARVAMQCTNRGRPSAVSKSKWTPSGATMGGRRIARVKAMGSPFGSRWTSGATAELRRYSVAPSTRNTRHPAEGNRDKPLFSSAENPSRASHRRCIASGRRSAATKPRCRANLTGPGDEGRATPCSLGSMFRGSGETSNGGDSSCVGPVGRPSPTNRSAPIRDYIDLARGQYRPGLSSHWRTACGLTAVTTPRN